MSHGVALIGPGDTGPWCSERSDEEFEGAFVRRFAAELRTGDVLLLRTGLSTIRAVGLVASDYRYLPQFDDVNGWDLQHGRRVRWCPLPEPYDFGGRVLALIRLDCRSSGLPGLLSMQTVSFDLRLRIGKAAPCQSCRRRNHNSR